MGLVVELFDGLDPVEEKTCNQCKQTLPITSLDLTPELRTEEQNVKDANKVQLNN